MNYGLDLQKELTDRKPTDYVFGAVSQPCLFPIKLEERRLFLPQGEVQFGTQDFQDCATRGPINVLEAKLTHAFQRRLLNPDSIRFLWNNGYIQNNRVVLSDRFTAIKSGTTPRGNSLIAPLDAIYRHGCIPKSMLPKHDSMDWESYHNKADITPAMEELGRQFRNRFTVNYERVNEVHFNDALKDDFLIVGLFAWPNHENGIYPRTDAPENHVVCTFQPRYYVFDNYLDGYDSDFIKQLSPDYNFYQDGYRIYISKERTDQEIRELHNKLIALMNQVIAAAQTLLSLLRKPLAGWYNL